MIRLASRCCLTAELCTKHKLGMVKVSPKKTGESCPKRGGFHPIVCPTVPNQLVKNNQFGSLTNGRFQEPQTNWLKITNLVR